MAENILSFSGVNIISIEIRFVLNIYIVRSQLRSVMLKLNEIQKVEHYLQCAIYIHWWWHYGWIWVFIYVTLDIIYDKAVIINVEVCGQHVYNFRYIFPQFLCCYMQNTVRGIGFGKALRSAEFYKLSSWDYIHTHIAIYIYIYIREYMMILLIKNLKIKI